MSQMNTNDMIDILVEILDEIDAVRTETDEEKSKEMINNILFMLEEFCGVYVNSVLEEEWRTGKDSLEIVEAFCEQELENLMHDYSDSEEKQELIEKGLIF